METETSTLNEAEELRVHRCSGREGGENVGHYLKTLRWEFCFCFSLPTFVLVFRIQGDLGGALHCHSTPLPQYSCHPA